MEAETTVPLPHSKKMKVLTTCAVLLGNITFGLSLNFFAPILEVLRNKYDTTVDQISLIFTIIQIAYCIGALSSGFIYYIINKQLGAIICLGGMAFGICATPHCSSLMMFYILGGALGLFFGAYDTAQVVWMIEVWQSKAGVFLQMQHFAYALGSNIPPLLLGPFLSKSSNTTGGENQTEENFLTILPASEKAKEGSDILIPCTIAGSLNTLACFYQIFLFIFYRYYTPPPEQDLSGKQHSSTRRRNSLSAEYLDDNSVYEENSSETDLLTVNSSRESLVDTDRTNTLGNKWSNLRLVVLSSVFISAYSSMEMSTIQFIPTFGKYSSLKLSDADAAFGLSGLTMAFAIGRGLGILIIMKVPPELMLCGNLILAVIGNLCLLFFASSSLTILWISCILMGFGLSTTYPTFFAYMERYLLFTNAIGSFILVSSSTVAAVYPLIIGGLIEKNPVIMTYTNFVSIITCTIAFAISYKFTYKQKFNKTNLD